MIVTIIEVFSFGITRITRIARIAFHMNGSHGCSGPLAPGQRMRTLRRTPSISFQASSSTLLPSRSGGWVGRGRPPKLISWALPPSPFPRVSHGPVSQAACQGSRWPPPSGWAKRACASTDVLGALFRGAPRRRGSRSSQGGLRWGEPRASFLGEQLFRASH